MFNLSPVLILLSSVVALISPVIYITAILKGQARPHRTTRVILLLTAVLSTAALLAQHDRVAIWLAGIATIQSVVILGLSLKYGMGGWSPTDIWCLLVALAGIVVWQTTQNPILALYASIAADFIGVIPTIIKTFHWPKTEIVTFYFLDTIAATLSLLAIRTWSIPSMSYPLYILLVNLGMVLLILRPAKK